MRSSKVVLLHVVSWGVDTPVVRVWSVDGWSVGVSLSWMPVEPGALHSHPFIHCTFEAAPHEFLTQEKTSVAPVGRGQAGGAG